MPISLPGQDAQARAFEAQRPHLAAVAFRLLSSRAEAEEAVQETWIRLSRTSTAEIENLPAWLTTVTSRVCLNILRSRRAHPEEPYGSQLPDVLLGPAGPADPEAEPEHELLLAESVGLALLVVLDTLSPAERIAFVLHDVLARPFDEIAELLGRSPEAARQLASRARRRVRAAARTPDEGMVAQRDVVDAFFAAARDGDLPRLIAVLHDDAVLRVDAGNGLQAVPGAANAAARAALFADPERELLPATVNGTAGVVVLLHGRPVAVMAFTVANGRVASIEALADPARLDRLDLSPLGR